MRTLLIASLFATTALLNAQTSPNGQAANLVARSAAPTPMATDVAGTLRQRPISTGVTAPKLIASRPITVSTSDFPDADLSIQPVVVHFTVDAFGVPQNVKLVRSVNPTVDARVIAAVSGFKYEPAKLNEWNVPMGMNLVVKFAVK